MLALVAGVFFIAFALVPAQAQSYQDLMNRLQRVQKELTTLQRHVYRKKETLIVSPNAAMARFSSRLDQLESEIRRLTGAKEELVHKNSQLLMRLEKMSTDVEFRLKRVEQNRQAKKGVAIDLNDSNGSSQVSRPVPSTELDATLPGADRGVRRFGIKVPSKAEADGQKVIVPLAEVETPEKQYARAHVLIRKRDWTGAERVLVEFINTNRMHRLASNAHYWLGRTYSVRQKFEQATITFAEGFQRYPKSNKAPVTLLNLGMSLFRQGKNRQACMTYSKLAKNYPKMGSLIKRRLVSERERSKCNQ